MAFGRKITVCFLLYIALCGAAFAQVVEIPDPNLRRVVRETLNLPAGSPITQRAMERPTRLEASSQGIANLTGLEYASNLAFLDLGGNNINNLIPIAGLVKLEVLWLWSNPLATLAPLADLTNLDNLDLRDCHIVDISPLAKLTGMRKLSLRDNMIEDIKPLQNLTQLQSLLILNNRIEDIAPLANLTVLTELNARQNDIWDLSPLSNITALVYLDLSRCRIINIAPLASLTRLEVLQLNDNQIVDVTPLTGLRMLRKLEIERNLIVDHSPLDTLSLEYFSYDPNCDLPPLPLEPRLENRTYPSAFGAEWIFGHDSRIDLMYGGSYLGMYWRGDGRLTGDLEYAIQKRAELMAKNPNMVFLLNVSVREEFINHYGEDWPYWVRDASGNIVKGYRQDAGLINFTHPDIQDLIVEQVIGVAKCGLFDGIVFDSYRDFDPVLPFHFVDLETQQEARAAILRRIRAETRANFLIQVNSNWYKIPLTGAYINGLSMEIGIPDWYDDKGFDWEQLEKILLETESTLLWAEEHLREPHINGVAGEAFFLPPQPTNSPENRRWVRVLTTLSMTHANGYVTYQVHDQIRDHGFWYDFLKADLGYPVGPKAQLYEERQGLYIREFTNGWAVYNHSGQTQEITLPELATGVASGMGGMTHTLPNNDGEMYLRVEPKNPADVNRDGVVNILDLTLIAQAFGTDKAGADVNGDGFVNILDLVFVANQF